MFSLHTHKIHATSKVQLGYHSIAIIIQKQQNHILSLQF